jgi:hypothetical protein
MGQARVLIGRERFMGSISIDGCLVLPEVAGSEHPLHEVHDRIYRYSSTPDQRLHMWGIALALHAYRCERLLDVMQIGVAERN